MDCRVWKLGQPFSTAAVAILVLLKVQDPEQEEQTDNTGLIGFIELLKIKALWPILIMGLVLYAPVANLRGLWSGPFLENVFGADSLAIGRVTLAMGIAMIVGSIVYGPLDKILNTRKWIIFVGNLVTLSAVAILASHPTSSFIQVSVLFVAVGLFGTSYGVLMAHGRSFVPKSLTGRGVTLLNFTTIFGAGAMQYITGAVANSQPNYLFSKDAKPHSVN